MEKKKKKKLYYFITTGPKWLYYVIIRVLDDRAKPISSGPTTRTYGVTVRPGARALNEPDVIPVGHRGVAANGRPWTDNGRRPDRAVRAHASDALAQRSQRSRSGSKVSEKPVTPVRYAAHAVFTAPPAISTDSRIF